MQASLKLPSHRPHTFSGALTLRRIETIEMFLCLVALSPTYHSIIFSRKIHWRRPSTGKSLPYGGPSADPAMLLLAIQSGVQK